MTKKKVINKILNVKEQILNGDYTIRTNNAKRYYVILDQGDGYYLYDYPYCEILVNDNVVYTSEIDSNVLEDASDHNIIMNVLQDYYSESHRDVEPMLLKEVTYIFSSDSLYSKSLLVTEDNVYYERIESDTLGILSKQISYEDAKKTYNF